MNYQRIYNQLIDRAKLRLVSKFLFYENHHIVPRCLGGGEESSNKVYLTPEEHFVCHQLLVKIYPTNRKLLCAIFLMSGGGCGKGLVRSNKAYGWLRRRFSEQTRGVAKPYMKGDLNPSRRPGFSEKVSGNKNPAKREEVRAKISAALRKDRSKPFECIETGIVYQTIEECLIWLRSLGYEKIQRASIQKVLSKKQKSRYGFHFEYCENLK